MVNLGTGPIEEHLGSETGLLWIRRDLFTRAPNVRLPDLAQLDERIDAHLDALRVAAEVGWQRLMLMFTGSGISEPGMTFVTASVAVEGGSLHRLELVLEKASLVEPAIFAEEQSARIGELIAALARTSRDVALAAIQYLRSRPDPHLRAVALAAMGARRNDPGPALESAITDQSALVRARAWRSAGQLGRADLLSRIGPALTDPDPEARFWAAWAGARMGAGASLHVLAEIARGDLPRTERALDLLLRRLDVPQANAWLREFAKLSGRERSLIRATGVIGDPLYIPWLIERMGEPLLARLAGEAFSMITGLDLAYRDLDRQPPSDFESGPNDDPDDENVALDEDENLPWPDPARIGEWWAANKGRFARATAYFLGSPKQAADWLEALSDGFQRQRRAAALELAMRQPDRAMFEVRARGRLQRQMLARTRRPIASPQTPTQRDRWQM